MSQALNIPGKKRGENHNPGAAPAFPCSLSPGWLQTGKEQVKITMRDRGRKKGILDQGFDPTLCPASTQVMSHQSLQGRAQSSAQFSSEESPQLLENQIFSPNGFTIPGKSGQQPHVKYSSLACLCLFLLYFSRQLFMK